MKAQENTMVKASVGHGDNRIEFELTQEQAAKVHRLQSLFRRQREERAAAAREGREPRLDRIKY
jgi:hypothetical protein